MGLDIYFYKVKARGSEIEEAFTNKNWEKVYKETKLQQKETFKREFDKSVKILEKTDKENYDTTYIKQLKRLSKFAPHTSMARIGGGFYVDKWKVLLLEEMKAMKSSALEEFYEMDEAHFRKANFIYAFFENNLYEEIAEATRKDLEALVARCEDVLKDHTLADELLPTKDGFFFGSTDYDKRYFNDVKVCKKEIKKLLKGLKADERVFVEMNW